MPAKKSSKWITHVKAYSKANNCSYGDAMSRAKSSYQKGSGLLDKVRGALMIGLKIKKLSAGVLISYLTII